MKYLFMCYTTRYKYFRSNKIYETTVASQCASAHYAVINSTLNFLSKIFTVQSDLIFTKRY